MEKILKSGLWAMPLFMVTLAEGQKVEKPNVLIIHTDEHSFRTLGCYRKILSENEREPWGPGVVVETPNIDYLADNGVISNRCYASSPVSSPSRSSFVSGLYPQQTGVVTNDIPMKRNVVTFAEDLQKNGYKTGYIGKWHLDGQPRPGWAPERKFGFEENRYMMNRGHYKRMIENGDKMDITYEGKDLTPENFSTDFWVNKTIDFIDRYKGETFCCVLSIPDPHGPNIVRTPYDTMYNHFKFQKPATARKDKTGLPQWSYGEGGMENMPRYFGMVKCIDDNIGRLLEVLRKEELLDNTIIVFTSDHGDMCGEHGLTNKSYPLEASAKVPFIVYYPAKIKAGTVVKEALSVVDFAQTILGLTECETSVVRSGRDASDLLADGKAPKGWKDMVFMRGAGSADLPGERLTKSKSSWMAVVTSRYKLVYSEVPGDRPWLTDLQKDPMELVNLYDRSKYRKMIKELTQEIKNYGEKNNDPRMRSEKIAREMKQVLANY